MSNLALAYRSPRSFPNNLLQLAAFACLSLGMTAQTTGKPSKNQKTIKGDTDPSTTIARSTPSTPAEKPPAQSTSQSASGTQSPAQSALAKLAATASSADNELQGDYIPCKFTIPELRSLIAPEVAPTLTAADEEILKQRVISVTTSQHHDSALQAIDLSDFVKRLANDELSGLTPSQALNRIIQDLAESQIAATSKEDINILKQTLDNATPNIAHPLVDQFMQYLGPLAVGVVPKNQLRTVAQNKFQEWIKTDQNKTLSVQVIEDLGRVLAVLQPPDTSTIVDAARNSIALLQRPQDVGCAMSILSYEETDQAYGHLIANTYIAAQVVVRNLNRDQSFVLHDVELEVNADPTGGLGRFFSGRDKVIVRALSAAQSSFDPRAILVHTAQGVGAILSAIIPVFNASTVSDASAVFNGAFVPGLDKYWKDQTSEQLNLLNDTGFSSQASSQTVVPVSGTVMFVTFIPSKPFEEGWWTQRCVEKTHLGSTNASGTVKKPSKKQQTGIDVMRALELCQLDNDLLPRTRKGKGDSKVLEVATVGQHRPDVDLFRNAYPVSFKKWSGTSLSIFREITNSVVSGTHIIEDSQLQFSISALSCPTDQTGDLVFSKPEKDVLSCTLSGKNLDKIAKVRLRNSRDQTDTSIAEGTVSVNGDSNNATVAFPTASLRGLSQPAYNVFAVSSKDVEQKTTQTIHLSTAPFVSVIAPLIDFTKDSVTPQNLTITGNHLATVDTVALTNPDKSKKVQIPLKEDALKSDTKLTVPLNPSVLTDFGTAKTTLSVSILVGNQSFDTGQTFEFTGPANKPSATPKLKAPGPRAATPETPAAKQPNGGISRTPEIKTPNK